jgi:GNAT superfamily N-acetyltransferase
VHVVNAHAVSAAGADAQLRDARTAEDMASARGLFEEYAASLDVDLCIQGFAAELAGLPGDYAPPRGRLLLARIGMSDVGCVALRPIPASDASDASEAGEVKRLYVRPTLRGSGLGRVLMKALILRARDIGYREIRLDTLVTMREARALYASLGFRACEPYGDHPLPGTMWMALALA